MSSSSEEDSSSGSSDPDASPSTHVPVKLETCANCGRTFIGEYCPSCGQRAGSGLSVLGILGGFVRELVETERGLWRTFRDFTLRPGTTVRAYLAGTRKPLTSPGRYLLVGAIVATVTSMILQGIGASDSNIGRFAVHAAQGYSEGIQDPGETAFLEGTAWSAAVQDLEQSGAYPALALVTITGIIGLLYRALFRRDTSSPAQAFAVAAYATAHASILFQGAEFVFELLEHYGAPRAQISTVFEWIPDALLLIYPGFLG